jgi:hypothetical protein
MSQLITPHFISVFEAAHPKLFTVYLALLVAAGDMGAPNMTMRHVLLKWLQEETNMKPNTISDCLNFLKINGVLATDERLDTLYFKFNYRTHAEVINVIQRLIVRKVTRGHDANFINETVNYFNHIIRKTKIDFNSMNSGYCRGRIQKKLKEFHTMKVSKDDIDKYFNDLIDQVLQGKNLETLLSPTGQTTNNPLTSKPSKDSGWAS